MDLSIASEQSKTYQIKIFIQECVRIIIYLQQEKK
jgi:hypothetical protein